MTVEAAHGFSVDMCLNSVCIPDQVTCHRVSADTIIYKTSRQDESC